MKKILAKIFGATGSNIAEKISNIIDKHTFSKVEKAQFEKEMAEVWINAESDIQKNVTERWKYDLSSDSFLSKNVRPLVLIFLVVSTVLMVFIDAGVLTFDLKESHTDLLQIILLTCIGAYFGGRSYEKIKRQ
jgi:tRNA U38,U39,U40 pseudouridine synthase TruA